MKNLSPRKELELLHQITDIISSTIELNGLLNKISKLIVDVVGADSCLIYLYNDQKETLFLSASHNPYDGVLGKIKLPPLANVVYDR